MQPNHLTEVPIQSVCVGWVKPSDRITYKQDHFGSRNQGNLCCASSVTNSDLTTCDLKCPDRARKVANHSAFDGLFSSTRPFTSHNMGSHPTEWNTDEPPAVTRSHPVHVIPAFTITVCGLASLTPKSSCSYQKIPCMANQNNITQDATGTPAIVTILATPHALIKCCSCGTPCGIHCAVGLQNLQNLRTGTRNTSNQCRISRSSPHPWDNTQLDLATETFFCKSHDEVSDGEDKERETEKNIMNQ